MMARNRNYLLETLLWVLGLIYIYPVLSMINTAFKSAEEISLSPLALPSALSFANFSHAFSEAKLLLAFTNSGIITAGSVLLLVLTGAMAAFPLSRSDSKGSKAIYLLFLAGTMLPFQMGMISLYQVGKVFHIVNSHLGVMIVNAAFNLSLTIFLYTGFLRTVSRELVDAASIDGCSIYRTFWSILFPIMKPVTATVVIITSLNVWNDFIISLLFLQKSHLQTINLSVYSFVGQNTNDWGVIFPSLVMAMLPILILYFFLQSSIIKGMASGAVKE
ncbi:carbohydrate ABC transporter permease [Cohnella sp. WQ 127256]|uniref:carbohydrate ABC transporter permease n=1 Tax=Cohnella sp. WQ 127256 TaxID=2938790 RepID=UPI00211949CE|nr:carbohydrate ABC transporter permease [Cohnella sp. WQ 127256]